MLNKEELEYYKNEYARFNHDKFMAGRPGVERVSTHINELADSHLEAIKKLERLKIQNEAMLKTIKLADENIVKAVRILMLK